jgi:hypothetical protein
MDDGLSAFERARPRLFGIAYRMLGSVAEAEDVVQDTWTRWQSTDRRVVRDPQAFLATTANAPGVSDHVADAAEQAHGCRILVSTAPVTRPITNPKGQLLQLRYDGDQHRGDDRSTTIR